MAASERGLHRSNRIKSLLKSNCSFEGRLQATTRGFARPARSLPHIGPYLNRMLARPAVQRAFATEKLAAPYV